MYRLTAWEGCHHRCGPSWRGRSLPRPSRINRAGPDSSLRHRRTADAGNRPRAARSGWHTGAAQRAAPGCARTPDRSAPGSRRYHKNAGGDPHRGPGAQRPQSSIANFNALIASTGPEWRQAYDHVQANLSAMLGPPPEEAGQPSTAVGTTGATAPASLIRRSSPTCPTCGSRSTSSAKPWAKPGQRAVTQGANNPSGAGQPPAAASGTAPNEQALRNIDDIGAIVSRLLSQGMPNQQTISVSRQDLQQIQQHLAQVRQSVGQQPIR